MAKVIKFYVRDLTPKKVRWMPPEQRGKLNRVCKTGQEVSVNTLVMGTLSPSPNDHGQH